MKKDYDLVETGRHAGGFRIFLQALEAAGLQDTLKVGGPYTVLAPVDDAFVKLPKDELENLFRTDNRHSLRAVLMNLIIPEKLFSADLKQRDAIKSVNGAGLRIESRGPGLWINEAQVVTPDREASNGVIQGIDTVLMPETQAAAAGN